MQLRLYTAGNTAISAQALHNLKQMCDTYHFDMGQVEVIDLFKDPMRAIEDGILVTPTLVRVSPEPVCTVIGTLTDIAATAIALGIANGGA